MSLHVHYVRKSRVQWDDDDDIYDTTLGNREQNIVAKNGSLPLSMYNDDNVDDDV